MTRTLLAHLMAVLLASMACPAEPLGQRFGPPSGGNPQPGQFFLTNVAYKLGADGTIVEDSCSFEIGPPCFTSIADSADGPTGAIYFALKAPTQTLSGAALEFAFEGTGQRSADVTTTTETTVFAGVPGKKVFARVVKTVFGEAAPLDTTELFSVRVGEAGASIPIALGEEFTEVTLPAGGTITLFFDAHVELAETSSGEEYDIVYAIEIAPDPQCKSDTHCPGPSSMRVPSTSEKCVTPQGVCTTGELGENCADPQDCTTGFCYSGRCSDGSPGSLCTIDRDCQDYCANIHCQAGNENDYCTAVEQCNFPGAHCPQVFFGYGLCTDGSNFDICVDDADCIEELACNAGVCGP